MKVAFLFPGQGAQKVGMGRELFDSVTAARTAFEKADTALDEPLSRLIFEGPAEELTLTANTQPAILTVSIAALEAFREKTAVTPAFVAGHSLGEFSALVAAGAMTFEDAVRTTRARGTFMQEAVPAGKGAMAAILGKISPERVTQLCRDASDTEAVGPANFNCPGQIVISGHKSAIERASAALGEEGAKVIPLAVSAPFHSPLMKPAAKQLDGVLNGVNFSELSVPVVTNVEAKPNTDANRIHDLLVRQVTAPVLWTDSIRLMIEAGVQTFIEFGPGNVLAGLLRKIDREVSVVSVNSPSGVDKAIEILKKL
ncbi:MAG: ACP S-malonyltransferase [Proteobacteria bacterium]|nr:ACP S-malonyltransferase [Pseudomonadota bacterium]